MDLSAAGNIGGGGAHEDVQEIPATGEGWREGRSRKTLKNYQGGEVLDV